MPIQLKTSRNQDNTVLRPGQGLALAAIAALILVGGFAGIDSATAGPPPGLVQISGPGPSPFAGCTADVTAGNTGTNYPNSEIEPWVAVNPTDPDNIVAGWQQDRWDNGGSRGLVAGV